MVPFLWLLAQVEPVDGKNIWCTQCECVNFLINVLSKLNTQKLFVKAGSVDVCFSGEKCQFKDMCSFELNMCL